MLTTVCSKPSAKNIPIGIHISSARPTVLRVALDITDPRLTSQLQRQPMPMAAHQPIAPCWIYEALCSAVWAITVRRLFGGMGTVPPRVNENQSSQAKN